MKASLIILFFSLLLTACSTNGSRENTMSDNQVQANTEIEGKKFPKAACILWIDKNKEKTLMNKEVRNV